MAGGCRLSNGSCSNEEGGRCSSKEAKRLPDAIAEAVRCSSEEAKRLADAVAERRRGYQMPM